MSVKDEGLFSGAFWLATIQRVIRSAAASLGSLLIADGTGILNTAWVDRLSVAGMAGVITLLLCVAGGTITNGAGPAFGALEVTSPPAAAVNADGTPVKGEAGYGRPGIPLLIIGVVLLLVSFLIVGALHAVLFWAGVLAVIVGLVLLFI